MAQAIAAFLVKVGLSAALASAVATAIVTTAITVGLNVIVNAIFGPSRPKPSDGQQNVNEAVGSRRRHYGIVHTGGQRSFMESRNGTLGVVVTLGTGREGEILEHRINDKPVTVVGGTVTDASFHGAVHIYTRSGNDDQTAIAELTAKFPEWTADHRQRGCAHAAIVGDPVKQKLFSEVYNNTVPTYTQIRRAAFLYDPRKDSTATIYDDGAGFTVNGTGSHRVDDPATWEWSDNWALVTSDYFAHPDGYGGGYGNVNWTSVAIEAGYCDEAVLAVSGETIARWRAWVSYSLASEERKAVLTDLLTAADGFIWQDSDGKFNLMSGRWEEPTLVITDDHILGLSATKGPKAQYRTSAMKVLYTEAAIGYREQESATIAAEGVDEDPNTDPQVLKAYYIPHHNQAWRTGSIMLVRLGDRWHLTMLLNLYGLNLLDKRFCRVETDQLGVYAWFMVVGLRLNLAENTIEATLDEVKPGDWVPPPEGVPPLAPDVDPTPVTVPVPTGLAVTAVQIALGETNGVAIAATWDAGRPDLVHEVQYRPSAGGDWVAMATDEDMNTARSGPVDSGTEYEVRIRAVTIGYRASDWSAVQTITPVATSALAAPSELAAEGGVGEAEISFRLPVQASLAYARAYGSASDDFGTAVQIGADIVGGLGAVVTVTDSGLSAGTRYYWARAFKASGEASPTAGSVSAIIS